MNQYLRNKRVTSSLVLKSFFIYIIITVFKKIIVAVNQHCGQVD